MLRAQKKVFAKSGAKSDLAATEDDIEIVNAEIIDRMDQLNIDEITLPSGKRLIIKAAGRVRTKTPHPDAPKLKAQAWERLRSGDDKISLSVGPGGIPGHPEYMELLEGSSTERDGVKFEPTAVVVEARNEHDKSTMIQGIPFFPGDVEAAMRRILENKEIWANQPKFGTKEFLPWIEKIRSSLR